MNPETNEFEGVSGEVQEAVDAFKGAFAKLAAAGGDLAIKPDRPFQPIWTVGERVEVNGYFFKVMDIGKDRVTLQPIGPYIVGEKP